MEKVMTTLGGYLPEPHKICVSGTCTNVASKRCGSCGFVPYCSSTCQKVDWKANHKKDCVNLKKISSELLTTIEIEEALGKMMSLIVHLRDRGQLESAIDASKSCLTFAKHQCGKRLHGTIFYMTQNGTTIDVIHICRIIVTMAGMLLHLKTISLELEDQLFEDLLYARQMLLDRESAGKEDNECFLCNCESLLSVMYSRQGQHAKTIYHNSQYLACARRYKGADSFDVLRLALTSSSTVNMHSKNYPQALLYAEEAYTFTSASYSPDHESVLHAAFAVIDCLILTEDYSRADSYCRVLFQNVTDRSQKYTHQTDLIAKAMRQLASIWMIKKPDKNEKRSIADADEAESFMRKAYDIMSRTRHPDAEEYKLQIAVVLMKRKIYTAETECIILDYYTHCRNEIDLEYPDYTDMIVALEKLGEFYTVISKTLPQYSDEQIHNKGQGQLLEILCDWRKGAMKTQQIKFENMGFPLKEIKPFFSSNSSIFM